MKVSYLLPLIIFVANNCFANELIISYAPSAKVKADTDEYEINENPYSNLTFDSDAAKGIRWVPFSKPYYIDFTLLDPSKGAQFERTHDYKSLSAGVRFIQEYIIDEDLNLYLGCSTGIGAVEFGNERNNVRSMAEASFKGGLIFGDTFTLGPEVKFQFVGSPGETVARVLLFNLNAGIRF
ncbi:hypothetical protein M0G74_17590 [Microbulbifer sp. CAU 1566]|uniref:hypothetical protein n=1 Tax=Microbulbifer sp. CAU 1566 TaxID=2933269 RepID=UPI0020063735|nr:hypothetical protein [Microbulbifer sp. CAU 1566]MCK7599091.1 hypothetical protein [Microbulbifer sp. CAU 1566]